MGFYANLIFVCGLFSGGQIMILCITFWYADHEKALMLLGYKFLHWYTFLGAYVFLVSPVILLVNFDLLFAYAYGFRNLFVGDPAKMRILLSANAVPSLFLLVWLYYGQAPTLWLVLAAVLFAAACMCLGKA